MKIWLASILLTGGFILGFVYSIVYFPEYLTICLFCVMGITVFSVIVFIVHEGIVEYLEGRNGKS